VGLKERVFGLVRLKINLFNFSEMKNYNIR